MREYIGSITRSDALLRYLPCCTGIDRIHRSVRMLAKIAIDTNKTIAVSQHVQFLGTVCGCYAVDKVQELLDFR